MPPQRIKIKVKRGYRQSNDLRNDSLGLRIGPACEAGLSVGMRRERVPPQRIKIKIKIKKDNAIRVRLFIIFSRSVFSALGNLQ